MASLKEWITHILALAIILTYVFLLIMNAFNPAIKISGTISTIALLVLGYYFGSIKSLNN